ncbi:MULTISPECIES: class I SAM-dependent methyltransferase [unclassified Mesorhizobium]|uniref:class I SAM-dependent methyltransferase n=1 Tax=unclassified Mesorhizobium TaxID=325217 RepID=UPI00163DB44F|nr:MULTISPECIES: class I SAM-dependent methyltransferase [unclassified Mesorhizobium]
MAHETWSENQRAIASLAIESGESVLDIGCGHGRSLGALASLAQGGRVVGLDPSMLMAEIAVKRNRELVRSRRVEVVIGGVDALPFADATFDKALCVHVIYFWDELQRAFSEIARVLRPGGRLVLVFRTNADEKAKQAFPSDVYRFPALTDVLSVLAKAGLVGELSGSPNGPQPELALLLARKP